MSQINPEKLKEFNNAAMQEPLVDVAEKIVKYVSTLESVASVRIRFMDHESKRLIPIATAGIGDDDFLLLIRNISDCIVGRAAIQKKTQIVDDVQSDEDYKKFLTKMEKEKNKKKNRKKIKIYESYISELRKIKSEIAIPIRIRNTPPDEENTVIGVMNVNSKTTIFSDETKASFIELKNALELTFLYRRYNLLNTLNKIEEKMMSVSSPTEIAQIIVNGVQLIVQDSIPTIFLFNEKKEGNAFEFLVNSADDETSKRLGEFLPRWNTPKKGTGIGESVVKSWIKDKTQDIFYVEENLRENKQASPRAYDKGVFTICCLPLIFKEKVVGVLFLHFIGKYHYFTLEERQILKIFAPSAAITIANYNSSQSFEKLCGKELINYIFSYNIPQSKNKSLNLSVLNELKILISKLKDSRDSDEMVQNLIEGFINIGNCLQMPNGLSDLISQFQKYEKLLLYNIPNYRDHFLHTFFVFSIGYFIINEWDAKKIPIFDNMNYQKIDELIKCWFISTIFHDIAYPLSNVKNWLPFFPKDTLQLNTTLKGSFDWSSFLLSDTNHKSINNLVELFSNYYPISNEEIKSKFRLWIHKQLLENQDHGILGALTILNINWNKTEQKIAKDAALAVALHNYTKNPLLQQLKIRNYPLAFLLTYCDSLEEWSRPSGFSDDEKSYYFSNYSIFFDKLTVDVDKDVTQLNIINDCRFISDSQENLEEYSNIFKKKIENIISTFLGSWSSEGITHQFRLQMYLSYVNSEDSSQTDDFGNYNIP